MSGARPTSETARRMGVVPFTGSSNGRGNKTGSENYPNISSNKSGDSGGYTQAPENVKASGQGGANNQLWSNGGSYHQGSAPAWPNNQQGAPMNSSNNFDNSQRAAPGPVGGGGGGYIDQGPQPGNGPAPQHQQQQQQKQQQPNWEGKNVQQGVPVSPNSSNNNNNTKNIQPGGGYVQGTPAANGSQQQPNWQGTPAANGSQQQPNWNGPQGGPLSTQGRQGGPMPKGDYVYYDGSGNQIQPGGGPPGGQNGSGHWTGSGSERHFHHHYYHTTQQQPAPAPAPIGYPYDKKMEQQKKRKPGAKTLAAALIACWACTCCCHVPCGC